MTGHVQDLWMRPGPNGRKVKGPRYGLGKRWQARWVERHGDTSKDRAKAFDSKDAALAHLARIAVHGPELPRPRITFAEYADTWLASQLHHRQHSNDAIAGYVKHMLTPELGRLPVTGITRTDVQNAVIQWSSHYSPATVRGAYGYTKTVFAAAMLDKIITESPCVRISLPEKEQRRIVPLNPDQVADITDRMPPHLQAAVTLAAATGLRIGELAGLDPQHLANGVVHVDRQLLEATNGVPVFGPPKTRKSVRDVSTGEVAWEAVERHLKAHINQHGLVFGTSRGTPLDRRRASSAWRTATKGMIGLPEDHGWHALRHFHASALIAAGRSPRAVADRLGHSTVTQTLNTYAHLWPTDDAESTAAIDKVLRRKPDGGK